MNKILNRIAVATAVSTFLLGSLVAQADTQSYRATQSGWSVPSEEQNVDAAVPDGVGFVNTAKGTSNLGGILVNWVSDLAEWDGFTFCDFDPVTGEPIAVELVYLKSTVVSRLENGDLLTSQLDTAPTSTLCFNFLDSSITFEVHQIVTGGTGRFDGATGSLVGTGSTQGLERQGYFQVETRGQINLVGDDDEDSDDDDDEDDD